MASKKTPEGLVVSAVCEYLEIQEKLGNGVWWKVRNMTYNGKAGGGGFFRKLTGPLEKTGLPDIEGIYKGRYIALEVKAPKGTQTQNQKDLQKLIIANGGEYHVIRSLEDVLAALADA